MGVRKSPHYQCCIYTCCAPLCLYKLVMPEREVAVCSADEGQRGRNRCPDLRIFYLLASHGILLHVYALAGYGCLLASLPRPNPLCQYSEFGFWLGTGKALWG